MKKSALIGAGAALVALSSGVLALPVSPGAARPAMALEHQHEVLQVHHKPGHVGGRGRHLGWYKANRGKHKGWRRRR